MLRPRRFTLTVSHTSFFAKPAVEQASGSELRGGWSPNTHTVLAMVACVTKPPGSARSPLESFLLQPYPPCPATQTTTKQASGASRRRRRQQRLDQLEIPVSEVEITDEVLGRGGFGTVYLADLGGLNAAAKVVVFEDEAGDDDDDDSSDDDGGDDDDGAVDGATSAAAGADGGEYRQPSKPETAEAAAVAAGAAEAAAAAASNSKGGNRGKTGVSPQSHQHRQQRRAFMRELEAMKRLRGPHTVTIYGAVTSLPDRLVLVSRPGGDQVAPSLCMHPFP